MANDKLPPADSPRHGSLLKSSVLIALRNLHHLLYLASLCSLLSYLLITAFTSLNSFSDDISQFNSFMGLVFFIYFTNFTDDKDWSVVLLKKAAGADSGKGLDPREYSCRRWADVCFKLWFVVFSIAAAVQQTEAYVEAAKVMAVCRNFGMVAMGMTIGGAMYAAQRLKAIRDGRYVVMNGAAAGEYDAGADMEAEVQIKGDAYSRNIRGKLESRDGSMGACRISSLMEGVRVSKWVSGVEWALGTLIWWRYSDTYTGLIMRQHDCIVIVIATLLLVPAIAVGFPALLVLCFLSTLAALDMSCWNNSSLSTV